MNLPQTIKMGRNLNMKKSWHPLSRQNLEKMMVESQKKKEENRKIKELEKEIKVQRQQQEWDELQGKKKDRVDFLYAGQSIVEDNEDYLLGKSTVSEMILKNESSMPANEKLLETSDLNKIQNKIRHDPLYQMKKSQMSKIKNLSPLEKQELLKKLKK
eukprot:NODE_931_length_3011_cov_0.275069.p2 type:complete len:158 gc:universal NODE_931_length_3011_cov_0.275069:2718-2245(-)